MTGEYSLPIQLDLESINQTTFDSSIFGDWISFDRLCCLSDSFLNAKPFPFVVIDNFFCPSIAEQLVNKFPSPDHPFWFLYYNPIEFKRASNDMSQIPPPICDSIKTLNHHDFINYISVITGIGDLEADPYLHGGGLHSYQSNGKLNMHLDYSIHPFSGKERRLNLIIYLNNDWDDKWGGDLEFWDDIDEPAIKIKTKPIFNRAVLFQTCDLSYHGFPKNITCPPNRSRNSIAVYYVSPPRENTAERSKAKFYATDKDQTDEKLKELLKIRDTRRITPDDLKAIYPEWESKFYKEHPVN